MEKDLVTVAFRAAGLKGPLGRPILVVCEGLDQNPQEFVILRGGVDRVEEMHRERVNYGPLTSWVVEELQTAVQVQFYTALTFWKGVMAEYEATP